MKKFGALALTLALAGLTFVLVQGCKPKGASPSKVKSLGIESAEKTSFNEVASRLDTGGSFYLYLSTEQWLKDLSTKVDKWHELAGAIPRIGDKDRQSLDNLFNIGSRLIKDSGLENISGIGMSSIAREPGLYYNKMIVHHYAGQGNGFIWTMFGKDAHELDTLNLLPANTAMAAFYDVDAAQVWSIIQSQCEQSGFPEAKNFIKAFPQQFEKGAGIKWDDALGSLGGEFGVVMTLDDSRMINIPLPTQETFKIPEPGLMIVMKIKNDAIFNRVDAVLKEKRVPGLISMDKDGVKMRTMPVPVPIPVTLRPSIAVSGGYLFIATSDALIQEAVAVKGGKAGLKSTDEFKKLSRDIPLQGNQFCFLSQRFGQTIMKVQQQAMTSNNQMTPQMKEMLQSFMDPNKVGFAFAVGANTEEGWMTVANGNQSSGNILAATAVVPAIAAAVALPALAKAKERAALQRGNSDQIACANNLRMIQTAKQQWAADKKKSSTDVATWEDIQPYLGRGRGTLRCPKGGEYTVGAVGESPTCSVPGHGLP
jgi:hypothetical protein